jgi:cytochrome c-type biogenesis protein CcmH/NrfF
MDKAHREAGNAKLIVLAAVAAAALGLGAAWWIAQPDHRIDSFTRLGGEIGCQCPTCPLRPIATCGCGFADRMLAELRELVDTGQSDEQIMTTLAARYDPSVRIKPGGSGLDLAAWAAPILLLTVGAVGVGAVLSRWVQRRTDGTDGREQATTSAEITTPLADEDARLREIIERELGSLGD